jgi:hypothetical protein
MGGHRALLAAQGLLEADHTGGQGPKLDQQQQGGDNQAHDGP